MLMNICRHKPGIWERTTLGRSWFHQCWPCSGPVARGWLWRQGGEFCRLSGNLSNLSPKGKKGQGCWGHPKKFSCDSKNLTRNTSSPILRYSWVRRGDCQNGREQKALPFPRSAQTLPKSDWPRDFSENQTEPKKRVTARGKGQFCLWE